MNIGNNVNFGNRTRIGDQIRNDNRAQTFNRHNVYNQAETRVRNADRAAVRQSAQQARTARGVSNDVLADSNGNVARRTPSGWETRAGDKWQNADRDAARERARNIERSQLQRDYEARQRGMQRERTRSVPRGGGRRRR